VPEAVPEPEPFQQKVPTIPDIRQTAVSLPVAGHSARLSAVHRSDNPFATPPQYHPEKVVTLNSGITENQISSAFVYPEVVSPIKPPVRRIEIQVADLVYGRERMTISSDFRQLETRAENECIAYFGGRPTSQMNFMDCMGETVGSLVYASHRADLIRYFETLRLPQRR
jgi:hypothetical protein